MTCGAVAKKGTTTSVTDTGDCLIIVRNVPCLKCSECGEEFLVASVAEKIDDILDSVERISSKIFILDYATAA